jgi:hypothetical protein
VSVVAHRSDDEGPSRIATAVIRADTWTTRNIAYDLEVRELLISAYKAQIGGDRETTGRLTANYGDELARKFVPMDCPGLVDRHYFTGEDVGAQQSVG